MPTVLITRAAHQSAEFARQLTRIGATPILFPTITVQPVPNLDEFDHTLHRLANYDWLIFTSRNAVQVTLDRLKMLDIPLNDLTGCRIAVVGPSTASALQKHHLTPILIPARHTAQGLLEALARNFSLRERKILLPQANIARLTLSRGLAALGAQVTALAVYETVPRPDRARPPMADFVTFTSPSTVQGYLNCLAAHHQAPTDYLADSRIVCIGPTTAEAVQAAGLPVFAVAEPHTVAGMVTTMRLHNDTY